MSKKTADEKEQQAQQNAEFWKQHKKLGISSAVVIAGAIVGISVGVATGGSDSDSSGDSDTPWHATSDAQQTARVMCHDFVKDQLKAPSTADFPNTAENVDDHVTWNPNDSTFIVIDHVDAENGFGGKLRNDYNCQVSSSDKGDNWSLDNLTFAKD